MSQLNLGYAMCGSFCTLKNSVNTLKGLKSDGHNITPIMSEIVYNSDTRFYNCEDLKKDVTEICQNKIINSVVTAEPIGPKKLFDILVVCPCTGNTLAKIANGITDTSVTMAVKAHLRNKKPVVLAIATNDALAASAKNIGLLLNTKNIYFVPFAQDDPTNKHNSLISDFSLLKETIKYALNGEQIQPILKK
ncbi:MAG: dipicolinate synthase subunit B [Ruminococcaceae bacterium]|nr:dipicolinate synthase subunit B [Oscillospiraceae bacterium]